MTDDYPDLPVRYSYSASGTYVYVDRYLNEGSFQTIASAQYIEDTWEATDRLTVYAGLRNEMFDNKNVDGKSFAKIDNQLAPRLGVAFDALGGGHSKLYANWGRYYLPIATNTNIRLGGAELYVRNLYYVDSSDPYDADGRPNYTSTTPYAQYVYGDGTTADTASTVNRDLEPQYQDEIVLGWQQDFGHRWMGGIRFIHRDLKSTLEDVAVDDALNTWAEDHGYDAPGSGFDYYVLTNPGKDIRFAVDLDGDGTAEDITLKAADLGYPKGKRKYNAIELTFERVFDGVWTVQGSYTWSQSYGNIEGGVNSDVGQDDTGLTISFDQPGLTDGAYGYLPNDRRHKIKLFAAYQVLRDLNVGFNAYAYSGRPLNAFGNYPDEDNYAYQYGAESFYSFGKLVSRGTAGRLPWTYNIDLSTRYTPKAVDGLTLGVDVFNIFNFHKETQVFEAAEVDYEIGVADPRYKTANAWQTPRYVRFSAEYKFGL
ncbi:MAG: hypothetical protein QM661_15110 [Solimonas sp.]